jgi:hypothetical protein
VRIRVATLATIGAFAIGALASHPPAHAAQPCCNITAIDAKAQTVTAKDTKTGRTFQFKVADAKTVGALNVGQPVHADFKTMKVSLNPDGIAPCCAVVNLRPATAPAR